MASEAELVELVQLGHDFASYKLYAIGATAFWAYDYFLTLKDEVRYAWKMESRPMFALFLLTRYLPGLFQAWIAVSLLYPGYTSEMCKKTTVLRALYSAFMTASAQAILTQRTYAITGKNKWVPPILYTISAMQFAVGVYMFVWSAMNPAGAPGIPLGSYHLCIPRSSKTPVIVQFSLSLSFDAFVLAFVLVQAQLIASAHKWMNVANVLDTVTKDTARYFVLMLMSHLLIVIMFAVARPGLRIIPVVGNAVFAPMMISRIIISLEKAASSRRPHTSVGVSTELPINLQDIYSPRPVDVIQLPGYKR